MEYRLISYQEIDQLKWDRLVKSSDQFESQYASYWYISSVSKYWSALVMGDYVAAFPFAHQKKAGFDIVFQPFFTRSFPFLGNSNDGFVEYVFSYFKKHFKQLDINLLNHLDVSFLKEERRVFQQLSLNQEYNQIQKSFSKNSIRILRKNQHLKIEKSSDLDSFISLFKETVGERLRYKRKNYDSLLLLIEEGINNDCMELFVVKSSIEVLAYGVFYKHDNIINFIKGAVTTKGKKEGAMYVLINHFIKKYSMTEKTLDFGGSNVENVSNFYKKFGAKDITYYNYSFNSLPVIIKKLKNIRTNLLK